MLALLLMLLATLLANTLPAKRHYRKLALSIPFSIDAAWTNRCTGNVLVWSML